MKQDSAKQSKTAKQDEPAKKRKAFVPAEFKKHDLLPVITAGSIRLS